MSSLSFGVVRIRAFEPGTQGVDVRALLRHGGAAQRIGLQRRAATWLRVTKQPGTKRFYHGPHQHSSRLSAFVRARVLAS
jgi:hypothetical protein